MSEISPLRARATEQASPPPQARPALRAVPDVEAPLERPAPRLEIPPYDLAAALALERELGVSHPFAQILVRRGLSDPDSARSFLSAAEAHDPAGFSGLERALDLIDGHIRGGRRITVHGDYDVDGVCATALLVRALESLGADVHWFLPGRLEQGYGLSRATVESLADHGTALLITVDCGIASVDEVGAARARGVDVVVTDHHTPRPDGVLPDCPVVHPSVCGYPCPELCGTGVAFKLAQALSAPTAGEDLELVALATVADLVPVRGENRRLVREGLAAMARTAKPGLRALMQVSGVDPSALGTHALGFRLGPRINAAGRLRRPDAGVELLMTEDPERAREIAQELDAVNLERRAVEQRMVWEAEAQIVQLGERSAYVLASEDWHPGVVGIVASRVVERYHRPAILIALDGDGQGQGSGRSIPGFDLLAALHASAEHMLRYGGHRAAAGLTIASERVDALRGAVERFAQETLTPELLSPVERVDAIVSGTQVGLELAEELAALEPCGIGNPRPRLLIPGARFDQVRAMGEGRHARFAVTSAGTRAAAVAFGCSGKPAEELGRPLQATFKLELNAWRGVVEPRLILCHARPCPQGAIEVLGEPERYVEAALEEMDGPIGNSAGQPDAPSAGLAPGRSVLDRRGESPLSVLADAWAGGGRVLALCADVGRRLSGLSERSGGYALSCYHAVERGLVRPEQFEHLVLLDPPSSAAMEQRLRCGAGFVHQAWGEAELRFAQQMHELEYGLRASLVTLYRSLRVKGRVAGEELERLLRGEGPHARPARLAGRLIKVLAELELVSLDRDLPALAVAAQAPTALERSPTYRACATRHEEGLRFLSSANHRAGA